MRVLFIGKGKHATTNLYPALPYAGIEVVESCTHDWKKVLARVKVDGVIACVNAKEHYEIAKYVAEQGIPIFIEKPPALNSVDAKELLVYKDKIMVGFNKRYAPVYQEAHRIIPKPESLTVNINIGKVNSQKEMLLEVGIHYTDLMRFFGLQYFSFQISDSMSWSTPSEHIELIGKGHLVIIENANTIIHHKPTSVDPGEIPPENEKTTIWKPNYSLPVKENQPIFLNGYVGELRAFANGKISPNIEDGYEALRILETMYAKT